MCKLNLIACVNELGEIVDNFNSNQRIKQDLIRFKQMTKGHIVVMSRKMYESIGKPLVNRINVVITKDSEYKSKHLDENIIVYNSIGPILHQCINNNTHENRKVFIIGGYEIYKQFINYVDKVELTVVEGVKGDKLFPMIALDKFQVTNRIKSSPHETPPYELVTYVRK